MLEIREIKNCTSSLIDGNFTWSERSVIKINSSSMRAVSTVPGWTF